MCAASKPNVVQSDASAGCPPHAIGSAASAREKAMSRGKACAGLPPTQWGLCFLCFFFGRTFTEYVTCARGLPLQYAV